MDAAVLKYRQMPAAEFYGRLAKDKDFEDVVVAAYDRYDFTHIDAEGWTPKMFNVPMPPARANEDDEFGPGSPKNKEKI